MSITPIACVVPQEEYDKVTAELTSLKAQYDGVTTELMSTKAQYNGVTAELTAVKGTLSTANEKSEELQSQIDKLSDQFFLVKDALTVQAAELHQLRASNNRPTGDDIGLQTRLDRMLDTVVTQYYQFSYKQNNYDWTLPIPLSSYFYYKDKPRPLSLAKYAQMATDPRDDAVISVIIRHLDASAATQGFSELEKANIIVAFIQSLPYTEDSVTTPYDEYARYPVETLLDRGGDCEDTSILAASLLSAMGYDTALLVFEEQLHIAVGVDLPDATGSYYDYDGKKYFYLETTGDGWRIGQTPPDFAQAKPYVYPVSDQ